MSVRPTNRWSRPGALVAVGAILLAGGRAAADDVVRFPAQRLVDGTLVPAHKTFAAEASDAAAASRREELLRSPYLGSAREVEARGGAILLRVDASLPDTLAPALASGLERAASQIHDRDGFSPPFSATSRLRVLVSAGRDGVCAAAWAGRVKGNGPLVDPVVSVTGGERPADAVVLDAVHGLAVLTLRRAAPSAPAWAVEGLAESIARRALGYYGDPRPDAADPLRADSGDARDPVVAARAPRPSCATLGTRRAPGGPTPRVSCASSARVPIRAGSPASSRSL
jgi:hypothetical protein